MIQVDSLCHSRRASPSVRTQSTIYIIQQIISVPGICSRALISARCSIESFFKTRQASWSEGTNQLITSNLLNVLLRIYCIVLCQNDCNNSYTAAPTTHSLGRTQGSCITLDDVSLGARAILIIFCLCMELLPNDVFCVLFVWSCMLELNCVAH